MEGQGGECGGGEQMVVRNEGVEGVDNVFRAHGGDAATEGESDQAGDADGDEFVQYHCFLAGA